VSCYDATFPPPVGNSCIEERGQARQEGAGFSLAKARPVSFIKRSIADVKERNHGLTASGYEVLNVGG
jgi:hypothetical protein